MRRWWKKFLKKTPLVASHPSRPTWKYDVDHYHVITIFGFELAILRLKN
jgi:hypothetical protein